MPYVCQSTLRWGVQVTGSRGNVYTVSYGLKETDPPRWGWSCTCPAGKYEKTCKHVRAALEIWCGWTSGGGDARANPVKIGGNLWCPWCHGPIVIIE